MSNKNTLDKMRDELSDAERKQLVVDGHKEQVAHLGWFEFVHGWDKCRAAMESLASAEFNEKAAEIQAQAYVNELAINYSRHRVFVSYIKAAHWQHSIMWAQIAAKDAEIEQMGNELGMAHGAIIDREEKIAALEAEVKKLRGET